VQILVLSDPKSGVASDLTAEYDSALRLFRVAGGGQPSSGGPGDRAASDKLSLSPVARASADAAALSVLGDREAVHRYTSFIIERANELAKDDHLGGYKWPIPQSRSHLFTGVADSEIVLAIFLNFCDSNLSPLVASEEHK
jgi:hypothetical protein